MFIRLTDLENNLRLVNINQIDCIGFVCVKGNLRTRVSFVSCTYIEVKETVSEISLLLQAGGKVLH